METRNEMDQQQTTSEAYEAPTVEVVRIDGQDIVTASGNLDGIGER